MDWSGLMSFFFSGRSQGPKGAVNWLTGLGGAGQRLLSAGEMAVAEPATAAVPEGG